MLLYHLTRPFSYLSIKHPCKWKYDWLVPIIFSTIITACFIVFGHDANYLSKDGFIDRINSFIQILPGFYIAALAAIATFPGIGMDQLMPTPTPKVHIYLQGEKNLIKLTRRRFLSLMFSYLTAICIILSITSIFCTNFSHTVQKELPNNIGDYLRFVFIFVYNIFFWQMITTTFFGLFYLGDRIHQPDN
jgi:hypothetical protein